MSEWDKQERWVLTHSTRKDIKDNDTSMVFRFVVSIYKGTDMSNGGSDVHELSIGGGPLVVKVGARKQGKAVPARLRVVDVQFDPEGIATADLHDDGTTLEFTDTGQEGEVTATIVAEVERRAGAPIRLERTLTLAFVEPAPDELDFEITD